MFWNKKQIPEIIDDYMILLSELTQDNTHIDELISYEKIIIKII